MAIVAQIGLCQGEVSDVHKDKTKRNAAAKLISTFLSKL